MSQRQRRAGAGTGRHRSMAAAALGTLLALAGTQATAQELLLAPVADATLYSEATDGANGGGDGLFAGRTQNGERRRSLLRFDLSSLPAGATLHSAELVLTMDRSIVGAVPVRLHRATASWGEGSAHAPGEEGIPAPAGTGDATWQWRFHATQPWATPGGDFIQAPSAETSVAGTGPYAFTGPGLLADLQAWRSNPAANHGWLLMTDEVPQVISAKRFASREHPDPTLRPQLRITYSTAAPPSQGARQVPATQWLTLLLLAALVLATTTTRPRP